MNYKYTGLSIREDTGKRILNARHVLSNEAWDITTHPASTWQDDDNVM
jgi:hypothetical protein